MLAMWTQAIVFAWSDDGHLHANRYNEAAVSIAGGKQRIVGEALAEGASVARVVVRLKKTTAGTKPDLSEGRNT